MNRRVNKTVPMVLCRGVRGKGTAGTRCSVPWGFARHLEKIKSAKFANKSTEMEIAANISHLKEEEAKCTEQAKKQAETLKDLRLFFVRRVVGQGRLYGSVTPSDIIDSLSATTGLKLPKNCTSVRAIRSTGTYKAIIHLSDTVDSTISIHVVGSEEEKEKLQSESELQI